MIPIRFRIDYWPHGDLPGFFASRYTYFTQYAHVFLGIALVILCRFFYNRFCAKQRNFFVLNWSDKYSYDVYLVHHVFVNSAFACAGFIADLRIALPLAVMLTIAASILLNKVSGIVRDGCIAAYGKLPN
jgi:membrane-bound acyltransferase YfiQ involved in biofilm formation